MTIKVKVYTPGFINHELTSNKGYFELTKNNPLESLCKKLSFPVVTRPVLTSIINYKSAELSAKVNNGGLIPELLPVSGG